MSSPNANALNQIIERLEQHIPQEDTKGQSYIYSLKSEATKIERSIESVQEEVQKYEEAYDKLTQPANRIGIFMNHRNDGQALIFLGEQAYVVNLDPKLDNPEQLEPGTSVLLNDAYAIVGTVTSLSLGNIVKVNQILESNRLRIGADAQNQQGKLIVRAKELEEANIKVNDEVRLDLSGKFAVEHFVSQAPQDYFVEDIPETPWSAVGGQPEAISVIKDSIEEPLIYPEIYAKFDKKPAKGILLYGPPGCGKTLIGKAIAYNLAKDYSAKTGKETKECFLHISGPKVLNMWLGETERMIREIFQTARDKANEGQIVVIFIDEAESILRTRSSGRYLNISNTVVPQFCAEMDGLVANENIVVVLTSNRPDYIDPAILRPERIDRKIRVQRPNQDATRDILKIYINESLPLDPETIKEHDGHACAQKALIEGTVAALFKKSSETAFLTVNLKNGASETLYWQNLVSGALLKSIVDRAKDYAIKRAIQNPNDEAGVNLSDLETALSQEFKENEIFPKSDSVEDWLKLLDYERENVVSVQPVATKESKRSASKNII